MSDRENRSAARSQRQRSRLRRWVVLSVGAHLAALVVLVPLLESEPEVETHVVTEVDLVDTQPETRKAIPQQARPPRETRRRDKTPRARRRRPVRVTEPAPRQQPVESVSELLIMRPQEPPPPPPPNPDRFASFLPRSNRPDPLPARRERLASVEVTRYADGGKVLRSRGGPPNHAELGLLELAAGKLGHGSGSQSCNPYRGWRGSARRELILIVDTSGSVVRSRRAPASLVCAAGAALAALKRGFSITVINFSSITQRYGPTKKIEEIYQALSTFQAQGTMLPRQGALELKGADPRDYVLISDAAIQNLKEVIPSYGKALRADPRNRAILYYLGASQQEDMDPAEALELIRRSGFLAEQV